MISWSLLIPDNLVINLDPWLVSSPNGEVMLRAVPLSLFLKALTFEFEITLFGVPRKA